MDTSKYKALYLQEAMEHVVGIESGLLAIEKDPSDAKTIDNLFRHYHSVKGMSASMGYMPIQKFAHVQEDLLDKIRSKQIAVSSEITTLLLLGLDALKELLKRVEENGELDLDLSELIDKIKACAVTKPAAPQAQAAPVEAQKQPVQSGNLRRNQAPPSGSEPEPKIRISHIMKVDSKVFDSLLSTVGDLVMSLSSFKSSTSVSRSVEFKDGIYMLGKHINTLYLDILNARMLPISDLTDGLPRVVRDLAIKSGKEVLLYNEGTNLMLDRSMLEGLGSPLVHIIRNAVDHGMEGPEERRAAGKPSVGSIIIKVNRKKDKVVISIRDDGKGIDVNKVKAKAKEKGVPEERLARMSESEALMLICMPGLSGADVVTETSGRGVGMDVVKDSVATLGGTLFIETTKGVGTTFNLELPLTTAIVKSLIVSAGHEKFLVPLSKIEKVVEIDAADLGAGTYAYMDKDIPVVSLKSIFSLGDDESTGSQIIIIVESGKDLSSSLPGDVPVSRHVAIRADSFGDQLDAYIKPLTSPVNKLWGVTGITIMGDGRPVFLIDVGQVVSSVNR